MSILIKGMKMPDHCWECWLMGHMICGASGELIPFSGKRNECPLVALPEKHGRLIDADALIRFVEDRYEITWESDCYEGGIKDACSDILEKIDTMPTVIEAEGE